MQSNNIRVDFALDCWERYDDDAKIFVGYIPALRVYSQGRNEEELKKALVSAAEMFIVVCYGKGILGKVLRDRGMTKAEGPHTGGTDRQYITVDEIGRDYSKAFEVKVPISLIAAQEVMAACLPQ
jgi:hypothetical protein